MSWTVLSAGQVFYYMSLIWDSWFFLMVRLGLLVFGRKTTEIKCHFHPITSRVHTISRTSPCCCWPWSHAWGSVCSVLPSQAALPPPCTLHPLEGSHHAVLTLKEQGLHLTAEEEQSTYIVWNSETRGICLLCLISIFAQSFIYIIWIYWYLFHTLGYNPMLLYAVAQIVSALPIGSSFGWLLASFTYLSTEVIFCFVMFVCLFLPFPYILAQPDDPGSSCIFPALVLESVISLGSPGSLY